MPSSSPNSYLETEVLTATPQKQQLILIEAAIRFAGRARLLWQTGDDEMASEALIRAQQIVTQVLGGLNDQVDAELTRKVASVYLFAFRGLVAANLDRDQQRLDEVIKVLEVERETWKQVCEKPTDADHAKPFFRTDAATHGPGSPTPTPDSLLAGDSPGGFSLEA